MELMDIRNINSIAQRKNYYNSARIVDLIICPIYSYVLYYNIEKSGFNAVSAYLLLLHLPNYLLQLTVT